MADQRLRRQVKHYFWLKTSYRPFESIQITHIGNNRIHAAVEAAPGEVAKLGAGSKAEAGDSSAKFEQPRRQPSTLEAGMAG